MTDHTVKAFSGVYTGEVRENGTVTYRGIRYASFKRWQRPVVSPESSEHFDALSYGPPSDGGDPGCLNLALYVNPVPTEGGKAVYMWQYGSAQVGGDTARFDFSNFVEKNPDIIVITPNHRGQFHGSVCLSVLGGYDEASGLYDASNNLARLDLLACLRWIHENISSFGGDPDRVTIGGHSSGSNNCTCLMMMEEARPYFHQAACQASFCCDTSLQPMETAALVSKELFRYLNVHTLKEALEVPDEKINEAFKDLMARSFKGEPPFEGLEYKFLSPVIDNVILFDDYAERLSNGLFEGKKLLIGHNSGEYDGSFRRFKEDPDTAFENALKFTISQNPGKLSDTGWNKDHASEIIKTYLSHNAEYGRDDFTAAMDLKNDLQQRMDALIFALIISKYADVYMYYNDFGIDHMKGERVSHGSENALIQRVWTDVPEEYRKGAGFLSDIFASFIRCGDPNAASLPEVWEKFSKNTWATMFIAENTDDSHILPGIRMKDTYLLLPLLREYRFTL